MIGTHLSLFSGIGGLDIAAEMAGFKTVGQCEWADYPTKVLEKHWPDVPRWRDIRTLTRESFYERTGLRTVDIISGGFPCQPFSQAGKRRGKEDDRYLWPEMCRVIAEIRPRWIIGENVAGIVSMALDTVLSDMEGVGYTCQAFVLPACAVDAPHRRDRCAIVAYSDGSRQFCVESEKHRTERNEAQPESGGCSETVPDGKGQGLERPRISRRSSELCGHVSDTYDWSGVVRRKREFPTATETEGSWADYGGGTQEYVTGEWWPAEPDICRVAHGVPARVDRLKCLGNAVVPKQFYPFFEAIRRISYEAD